MVSRRSGRPWENDDRTSRSDWIYDILKSRPQPWTCKEVNHASRRIFFNGRTINCTIALFVPSVALRSYWSRIIELFYLWIIILFFFGTDSVWYHITSNTLRNNAKFIYGFYNSLITVTTVHLWSFWSHFKTTIITLDLMNQKSSTKSIII